MDLELQQVAFEDKLILRNLLELCQHDYREFDGDDVNEYGLSGYRYLDHYWTEPGRYPFLVRVYTNGEFREVQAQGWDGLIQEFSSF